MLLFEVEEERRRDRDTKRSDLDKTMSKKYRAHEFLVLDVMSLFSTILPKYISLEVAARNVPDITMWFISESRLQCGRRADKVILH